MSDKIVKSTDQHDYVVVAGKLKTYYRIDREVMEVPTGKFRGSLPWNILINGVRWECVKTGIVKSRTYDKIQNTETKEYKTFERQVLIDFLIKNWKLWQKNNQNKIVISDNNCTFGQSEQSKQLKMVIPRLDF